MANAPPGSRDQTDLWDPDKPARAWIEYTAKYLSGEEVLAENNISRANDFRTSYLPCMSTIIEKGLMNPFTALA